MTAFMFQLHKFLSLKGEDRFSSSAAFRGGMGLFKSLLSSPLLMSPHRPPLSILLCALTLLPSDKTADLYLTCPAVVWGAGIKVCLFSIVFSHFCQPLPVFHIISRSDDSLKTHLCFQAHYLSFYSVKCRNKTLMC